MDGDGDGPEVPVRGTDRMSGPHHSLSGDDGGGVPAQLARTVEAAGGGSGNLSQVFADADAERLPEHTGDVSRCMSDGELRQNLSKI